MSILVTGGAGFVGGYLTKRLIEKGEEVIVLDNLITGKKENIPKEASFIKGDVKSKEDVKKALRGDIEKIFHLAGHVSVHESLLNPVYDAKENIIGTLNIIKEGKEAGLKSMTIVSSAAVYGNPLYLPIKEEHPLKPTSGYGVSKKCLEEYCNLYKRIYNTKI